MINVNNIWQLTVLVLYCDFVFKQFIDSCVMLSIDYNSQKKNHVFYMHIPNEYRDIQM